MPRFSDRLTSSTAIALDDPKDDESASDAKMSPSEQDYHSLVEVIGLHRTLKVLESEYTRILGVNGTVKCEGVKHGYISSLFSI
jgi:hypothetical protein